MKTTPRAHNSRGRVPAAALAALLGATCASPSQAPAAPAARAPAEFPRFPAEAIVGEVVAGAKLYTDHELIFGADLARDAHVLPIALKLGLAPGSQARVRFAPDDASVRLYAPDGAVLSAVPAAAIPPASRKSAQRVAARALGECVLGEWSAAREGFVYFLVEPVDEFHLSNDTLLHKRAEMVRQLALSRALIGFDLEVDGRRVRMQVGLDVAVSAERK